MSPAQIKAVQPHMANLNKILSDPQTAQQYRNLSKKVQ
jgi:membrane protein insertase Oxa1/YidC/SpoIIIJ